MTFQPILGSFKERPVCQGKRNPWIPEHNMIRDQFPISTWMLFGAVVQGLASALLPYRNIVLVLPVVLILGFRGLSTLLMVFGVIENKRLKHVIYDNASVALPTEKGMPSTAGQSKVCAILLGTVSHHPLGMLGPGFAEVKDRFDDMADELAGKATQLGYLGYSAWLGASESTSSNSILTVMYFENEEYLYNYAHGPLHSQAVKWWYETEKKHGHIGINHEVFACPKHSWEAIYGHYHPTGLGAVTKEVIDENGQKSWMSPLYKIRGKMRYGKARMGRSGEYEAELGEDEAI